MFTGTAGHHSDLAALRLFGDPVRRNRDDHVIDSNESIVRPMLGEAN